MIKKTLVLFIGIMLLAWCGVWVGISVAETTDNKSQLTVPWDEFKRLLHLDEDPGQRPRRRIP
jgi:hypothetical protein